MKNKYEPYVSLPYRVIKSESYRNLSSPARTILIESMMSFRPSIPDNTFTLPYSLLRKQYGFSRWIIKRALDELIENRFFEVVKHGKQSLSVYKHNTKFLKICLKNCPSN